MVNRQWVLAARPEGPVKHSDFRLIETPLRPLADGEFRIRTRYLGVAAVMRGYMLNSEKFERPLAIGDVMHGRGVGEIVESRNPAWPVGDIVQGKLGWQDYAIADGSDYFLMFKVRQRRVPISTALGVLGLTGFTSYLGLVDIGAVRAGDHVLVSGAAGGVGSNVGQIARNLGASAVGIAGSAEKCRLLTENLGYRAAIDYRLGPIDSRLAEAMPEISDDGKTLDGYMNSPEYKADRETSAQEILGPAKATADAQGITANIVHVLDRYAADGIIDTATERSSDLIVMTSHGRRGVTRVLLGSQTAEVLARSTIPVLVIR